MKCITCIEPGKFRCEDRDYPILKDGYSLVKISRLGICGTDIHAFEGTQPYFTYPRILGHEIAGTYLEGNANGFTTGDIVTIVPYFHCGKCIACRTGKPNCCTNIEVCGVHCDGAMREYLLVPDYSLIKGNGLSIDQLSLVEPLSISAHAVKRAAVKLGEFVLVVGTGPIGLGIMEFARIAGAEVIAMDINSERLNFCKETLSFKYLLNGKEDNIQNQLKEITAGDMPVVLFNATGNKRAMENTFSYMAHTARYILVGLQKEQISFSHPEFHKREATLMSSRNATKEDFAYVMQSIQKKLINPLNYITHRFSFDNVASDFKMLLNPSNNVRKAIIELD